MPEAPTGTASTAWLATDGEVSTVTRSVTVTISISPEEYVKAYQAPGKTVWAVDGEGRSIRFPANILRPFVEHDGIRGSFRIEFNDQGKFSGIERVEVR